jgi:cytoskeletal protein CcmA (bactofilin family)
MFNKSKPGDTGSSSGLGIPTPPPEPARTPVEPYKASEPYRAPEPQRAAAPAAPSPAASRSSNLSTLSGGVKYEGNISGGGELQVDGTLKGDIRVVRVMIGETGVVEGAVAADLVEVRGRVAGSIVGKTVKLYQTARVEGDVTQEQLTVEQGAWFQGRCIQAKRDTPGANMLDTPADKAAAPAAKTEAKVG